MKKIILLLSLLLTAFVLNSFVFKKEKKILIYTRNFRSEGGGFVHENIKYSVDAVLKLGKDLGYTADTSSSPEVFTDNNLKQYSAIIFANSNNEAFANDAQRLAFRRYIEAGGAYGGIHSSTGSERKWKWFINMQGGLFLRHAKYQKYTVRILDRNHDATKGLVDNWEKEDECYYFLKMNPAIKVIMVADLLTVDDPQKPDMFYDVSPAVWCNKFDGGRQWYTALGHNPTDYSDETYIKHLKNGIKWLLDNDKELDYSKAYALTPYDDFKY